MPSSLHCVRFSAVVCSNHLGGPASPDLLSRFHTRTAVQAQPWHRKAAIDVPLKAGTSRSSSTIAQAIAYASWPILATFKMLSCLEYWVFFGAVFFTKQVSCGRRIVFRTFLAFLIFDPN